MAIAEHVDPDFYLPSSRARKRLSINPRVLFIDDKGNIPLLPHKGWYGLFGGHIKKREMIAINGLNLLAPLQAFPTLQREVNEEALVDMSTSLRNMACLGLADIEILDLTGKTPRTTNMLSPIFICHTPVTIYPNHVHMARLDALPKPLYPDAALSLWHIRRNMQNHTRGPILPDWLNHERHVVFVKTEPESFVKFFHI